MASHGASALSSVQMDRTGSLQRMLELETQFKLARLGIGRAESTPNLLASTLPTPSDTTEPDPRTTLQDRRRLEQPQLQPQDPDDPMFSSFRRSISGPPLSIDIPPPPPPRAATTRARSNSTKTVSFAAPDDGDSSSEHSSICQSPSWDFDKNRSKKKKKSKKKKEKEPARNVPVPSTPVTPVTPVADKKAKRASKLSKLTPRRLTEPPVPPVPPMPSMSAAKQALSQSSSAAATVPDSGVIVKTTDLRIKSTPLRTARPPDEQPAIAPPRATAYLTPDPPQNAGFVGGIRLERLERDKNAAAHSRRPSLSLFPNSRPLIHPHQNALQPRSYTDQPDKEASPLPLPLASSTTAALSRSMTMTELPTTARHTGGIAPSKSILSATASKVDKFFKPRQAKSNQTSPELRHATLPATAANSAAASPETRPAQVFKFPQVPATPTDGPTSHQSLVRKHVSVPATVAKSSSISVAKRHTKAVTSISHSDLDINGVQEGLSPPPRQAAAAQPAHGSVLSPAATHGSSSSSATAYLGHRQVPESPPDSGTARSFKEKAMAMLHRSSLPPPPHEADGFVSSSGAPAITGPFDQRGSGSHFLSQGMESEIGLAATDHAVAAPTHRIGQATAGSSSSSFDESYMTSPATTPESSRPQSAKEVAAVGDVSKGTGKGRLVADDSRAHRHSQAAVVVMNQSSQNSHLRRSSSSYSQVGSPFHLEESARYEFLGGKPVLTRPPMEETFVIRFDGVEEIEPDGPPAVEPLSLPRQTSKDLVKAGGPVRQHHPDPEAVWQSVLGQADSDASDSSAAASQQEESDGSGTTAVDVSFLPPLKHEPFIPPKSMARKSRMVSRAATELTTDDEDTVPSIAIAVDPQHAKGAAYLREARKSVLMPPSIVSVTGSVSHSRPPRIPRLSLGPPVSSTANEPAAATAAATRTVTVVPKMPITESNRLSTQSIILPSPTHEGKPRRPTSGVTVSRRSLLLPPVPSSAAAPPAPGSKFRLPPRDTGGDLLGQKVAKMLVECCNCRFLHDMPSRVYECMASPDAVVEDHNLGISGAITTMVKCPWCVHNMSTSCCAGYTAVIHLTERMH